MKKNKKEGSNIVLLPNSINIEFTEYTKDIMLNKYLNEKKEEAIKTISFASLNLGKLFQEVKDKIGGSNQYDGLYVNWLEDIGTNKMTALRHRNRYYLYRISKTDEGKNTIASLPVSTIQDISKIKDITTKSDIMRKIDAGATKEEVKEIFYKEAEKEPEKNIVKEIKIYDFEDEEQIKSIETEKELEYYIYRYKKFKAILEKGNNLLLNKKTELFNNRNKY